MFAGRNVYFSRRELTDEEIIQDLGKEKGMGDIVAVGTTSFLFFN